MNIYYASRGNRSGSEAVYSLLEYSIHKAYGMDLPIISRTANGKPYFPGFPDLHFSLSHSRTHVLCAVSHSPVGCDIESPRQIGKSALKFFYSAEESAMFDPLELWVLKESYIKLLGQTVASIRKLRFSRNGNNVIVQNDTEGFDRPPVFRQFYVADCHAAVCTFNDIPPDTIEYVK